MGDIDPGVGGAAAHLGAIGGQPGGVEPFGDGAVGKQYPGRQYPLTAEAGNLDVLLFLELHPAVVRFFLVDPQDLEDAALADPGRFLTIDLVEGALGGIAQIAHRKDRLKVFSSQRRDSTAVIFQLTGQGERISTKEKPLFST
jgi:hypothetical protein